MRTHSVSLGDFRCAHCHAIVPCAHFLSGVNNRNHCPYCLWSCHLDLYVPGDRLSACKAPMRPIGLTMKKVRNKYQREPRGELMLVHECVECKVLSINRIAADDDSATVTAVFHESLTLSSELHTQCMRCEIITLNAEDSEIVYTQLYGRYGEIPIIIRDVPIGVR